MTGSGFRAIALSCLGVSVVVAAQPANAQQRAFNIPAQDARTGIPEFGRQAGVQISAPTGRVEGVRTNAVSGTLDIELALKRLIAGTGLEVLSMNNNTIILRSTNTTAITTPGARGEPTTNEYDTEYRESEIIVTAQKRTERMLDVPVPMSAVDARELTTSNQLRIQDYFRTIPGLSFALAGNGAQPVLTIRGINTGDAVNPVTGIVINEVPYGATVATGAQIPAAPDIDPGDLERVEVLRGPQGALYGASSIGGLIKFVTIAPSTDRFSGRIQAGLALLDESDQLGYNLRGSVNAPVSDTFALRGSGFVSREPGYVDNATNGDSDANERRSYGGRLAGLLRLSDDVSLRVEAVYQDAKRRGADEINTALGSDPSQAYLDGTGLYRRTSQLYTATVNARLGTIDLVAASGYSIDDLSDNVDVSSAFGGYYVAQGQAAFPQFGVTNVIVRSDIKVTKFSQEVRATVPVSPWLSWVIGGFYTKETTTSHVDTPAVNADLEKAGSLANFRYQGGKFEDLAVFSNATINLSNRLDVQVGARYSDNSQDYPLVRSGVFFPGGISTPRLRSKDDALTYLLTPRFRINPNFMIYARLASGYRPGGPNVLCGEPDVPCTFKADTSRNFDLGVKGTLLEGKLIVDASVYTIDWKDLQIPGICTPDLACVGQYTGNASRARSSGVELALGVRPGRGLEFDGWFAITDARLADDLPVGSLVGVDGDRLPYSSKYTASLSARQALRIGPTSGYIQGRASYVGKRTGDFKFTADREVYPDYWQLDARAGAKVGQGVSLDFYVNNLTNKRAIIRGGLDSLFVKSYVNYIQPRSIGLTLVKTF